MFNGIFVDNLHITLAAINLTPKSGISHWGKNGCMTYLAKVRPIIAFVVGLHIKMKSMNSTIS